MMEFDKVIGLGFKCRTGFQIRRIFGKHRCVQSVFDRQVTPLKTVVEYFRRDFRGMFEREDLIMVENVTNARFDTWHLHEFESGIESGYALARERHDKLCENVRSCLHGGASILLVAQQDGHRKFVDELTDLIRAINPRLEFRVVAIDDPTPDTNDGITWRGNNLIWDVALNDVGVSKTFSGTVVRLGRRFRNHILTMKF